MFNQQITPSPGVKHVLKVIKRNSPMGSRKKLRRNSTATNMEEPSMEQPRGNSDDDNSSQDSASTTRTSRKPSRMSGMVPLTPVVASSPENQNIPLFSDDAESVISDLSKVTASTPVSNAMSENRRKKLKAGSVLSIGSPERPEMSSEMTALLAEIKGTVPLRKSYNEEEV